MSPAKKKKQPSIETTATDDADSVELSLDKLSIGATTNAAAAPSESAPPLTTEPPPPTRDITEEFFQLAKELQLGEIAMHPQYSLSDAVSAIELMDPKMDSGLVPPDSTLGLKNALESGKLKQKLSVTELLATTDATLAAIASWLKDEQALDQTVYTNLWLHDLQVITEPVHLALSTAAICLIQTVRSVVNMAACYNEEDFASATSFEIAPIRTDELQAQLLKAEETVMTRVKSKQNKQENNALLNRIRFYQQFLEVFDCLLPPADRNTSTTPSDQELKWQPKITPAKNALKSVLVHLQSALETVRLGRQPSDGKDGDFSWLTSFQPRVNQHLLPPTFPREVRLLSRQEGYKFLMSTFQATLNLLNDAPDVGALNMDMLMEYVERYSYAGILVRSICQLLLLPTDDCLYGIRPMMDLLIIALGEFLPAAQLEKLQYFISNASGDVCAEYDDFVMDAVRGFLSIVQLFGHNRSRFHDKYLPELIDVFTGLRDRGQALEHNLHEALPHVDVQSCFSTFADFYTTRLSNLYMDMGFQLELYVDYELPYIYWFYVDIVYPKMIDFHKRRIQSISYEYQRQNSNDFLRVQARERAIRANLYRAIMHHDLATAYFLLFSALADDGKVKVPPGEEHRFWRRMHPCSQILMHDDVTFDRYWNYFFYAREPSDPPTRMTDWTVETRYSTALEYFKRTEAGMLRNYIANEALGKAIRINQIAIRVLTNKLDTGKRVRVEYQMGSNLPTLSIK